MTYPMRMTILYENDYFFLRPTKLKLNHKMCKNGTNFLINSKVAS